MTDDQEWKHTKQVCHIGNWLMRERLAKWPEVMQVAEGVLELCIRKRLDRLIVVIERK